MQHMRQAQFLLFTLSARAKVGLPFIADKIDDNLFLPTTAPTTEISVQTAWDLLLLILSPKKTMLWRLLSSESSKSHF